MKSAIENINEDLTENLNLKEILADLFGYASNYLIVICQDEEGEISHFVRQQNSSNRYSDFDPEICSIKCGWDLQEEVISNDDYIEDEETGEWGIKGADDVFEYVYQYNELEDTLLSLINDSIDRAQDEWAQYEACK